jgi:hypothetical protein
MVFNATFSFIGGLEEVRAPEENKRPVLGHWQILWHNVVSVQLATIMVRTHNFSDDRHQLHIE